MRRRQPGGIAANPHLAFRLTGSPQISPDGPEHFLVIYAKTLAMLAAERYV